MTTRIIEVDEAMLYFRTNPFVLSSNMLNTILGGQSLLLFMRATQLGIAWIRNGTNKVGQVIGPSGLLDNAHEHLNNWVDVYLSQRFSGLKVEIQKIKANEQLSLLQVQSVPSAIPPPKTVQFVNIFTLTVDAGRDDLFAIAVPFQIGVKPFPQLLLNQSLLLRNIIHERWNGSPSGGQTTKVISDAWTEVKPSNS
jgi:hypothetical protein